MTQKILFDTSFYIRSLRQDDRPNLRNSSGSTNRIYLCAVVVEELFAGAADTKSLKALRTFEESFSKVNRLIVPNQSDWTSTGLILNKIGRKYGFDRIGKQKLTNDALLAATAGRLGIRIVTANARDFTLLREFRNFEFEVI